MGDDLLDIPILERAGLAICVANGVKEAKRVSHYVTQKKGGDGAVREVVEMLLQGREDKDVVQKAIFRGRKKPKR